MQLRNPKYTVNITSDLSNVLLLIIGNASLVAFMQISKGHWRVHKDPPYILVLDCYLPVPLCMFSFQGKAQVLVADKQNHANVLVTQPQGREHDLKTPRLPPSSFCPLRHLKSAGKKKSGDHKAAGILLMGPGRTDLFAQGIARRKSRSQRGKQRSCPGKLRQVWGKGQGKALGGINESIHQKQDLNVGCEPDQGKVQHRICEQYKGLKAHFTK